MPVNFNRRNPATEIINRYMDQGPTRRAERRQMGVDEALRAGLAAGGGPMAGITAEGGAAPPVPQGTTQVGSTGGQPVWSGYANLPQGAGAPPGGQPGAAGGQPAMPMAGGGMNPVAQQQIQNLAQTPGGGALGTQMQGQQFKANKQQQDQVWQLMKTGTEQNNPMLIKQAKSLAQQIGLQMPPAFFDDEMVRTELVGLWSTLKDAGMNDKQIAAATNAFLLKRPEIRGRIQESLSGAMQAGSEVSGGGDAKYQDIIYDEDNNAYAVMPDGSTVPIQGAGGKQLRGQVDPAKQSAFERKVALYQRTGKSLEESLLMATRESQMDPMEAKISVMKMLSSLKDASGFRPRYSSEDELAAAADKIIGRMRGGGTSTRDEQINEATNIRDDLRANRITREEARRRLARIPQDVLEELQQREAGRQRQPAASGPPTAPGLGGNYLQEGPAPPMLGAGR